MIKKFEEFTNEGTGSSIRNWFYDKPKKGDADLFDWVEEPEKTEWPDGYGYEVDKHGTITEWGNEDEKEEEEEWEETKANRTNWNEKQSSKRKRRTPGWWV